MKKLLTLIFVFFLFAGCEKKEIKSDIVTFSFSDGWTTNFPVSKIGTDSLNFYLEIDNLNNHNLDTTIFFNSDSIFFFRVYINQPNSFSIKYYCKN